MRKIILLACVLSLPCLADWAFVRGSNVLFTVSQIPSTGRIQATQEVVIGLQGASEAIQRACGYWMMMDSLNIPEGMRIASSSLVIRDNLVEKVYTYKSIPPRNYTVSKYKLITAIDEAGKFAEFNAWIKSLPEKELMLWNAATSLDSTNALVQAAIASMPALFNVSASMVTNIVERSEIDAK